MKRRQFLNVFIFLLLLIIFPKNAYANGIIFSVQKSADNLKPKQEVVITIKGSIPQNSQLQSYQLYFKPVDQNGNINLSYVSGQGSPGVNLMQEGPNLVISYSGSAINSDLNPVATLRYRVNDNSAAGNVTLKLDTIKCNRSQSMSCSSNNSNLTIASIGSDATLKSLKIPNSTLSPAFSKNTYEYTAQVKDVDEVTVNAEASDPSSKISISNNYKKLQKGNNLVKIQVTAENGASKTYNINVVLTKTPTEEELLKSNATLKKLKIKGQKLDFLPDEKKYFLEVKYNIKKLNIEVEATNKKSDIKIDNPKLKIGKNTITITVISEDKTAEETYQVIVTRKDQKKEVVKTCPDVTSKREWVIFYISLIITMTLGIVLGYFLCKKDILKKIFKKRKKKEKKKDEKEDALSDTIELDTTQILEKAKKK